MIRNSFQQWLLNIKNEKICPNCKRNIYGLKNHLIGKGCRWCIHEK